MRWLNTLSDAVADRVTARLRRLVFGNPGDSRHLGEGVHEIRIRYGIGIRFYFGYDGQKIVVLLLGGDKSTQQEDIAHAKAYWNDYKQRRVSAKYSV
ncbi:MAG TPA: type II toxin-antitoxin system RelE/ParE family toxin [Candidatus Kapabacteria bacterium]|nr:type II toxin-antitoxin system RelE/ParE family toxin [Candidatus Kapabacteria bacterium]